MRNGTARDPRAATTAPEENGPIDCATLRAVFVPAFAAVRSLRPTIPARYAWRVGTSIWERAIRARYAPRAGRKPGARGTAIRRRFEGMWVNTIVSRSPNRSPRRAAARKERAVSTPAAENTSPRVAIGTPY